MTASFARELGVDPHVAMLSFANFGSSQRPEALKVAEAVKRILQRAPGARRPKERCRCRSLSTQ